MSELESHAIGSRYGPSRRAASSSGGQTGSPPLEVFQDLRPLTMSLRTSCVVAEELCCALAGGWRKVIARRGGGPGTKNEWIGLSFNYREAGILPYADRAFVIWLAHLPIHSELESPSGPSPSGLPYPQSSKSASILNLISQSPKPCVLGSASPHSAAILPPKSPSRISRHCSVQDAHRKQLQNSETLTAANMVQQPCKFS
jgi:hypothetical protein